MTWVELLNDPMLNVIYKIEKDTCSDQNDEAKILDAIHRASKAYLEHLSSVIR